MHQKIEEKVLETTRFVEARVYDINIIEDYVYYYKLDAETDSAGIYRIDKDGTNETELLEGTFKCLTLVGQDLYFTKYEPDRLYRMHCDGTGYEVFLSDACDRFLYSDGYFYTTEFDGDDYSEYNLIRYHAETGQKELLLSGLMSKFNEDQYMMPFFICGKKLVYQKAVGGSVMSSNLGGTDEKVIISEPITSMIVSSDKTIYCEILSDNEYRIGAYDSNGNLIRVLKDNLIEGYNLLGVSDDELFYNHKSKDEVFVKYRMKLDGTEDKAMTYNNNKY